jgi:hypothetical protein
MKFVLPLLLVLAGWFIWAAVENGRLVSPSLENESAFLKTYTPAKVIAQFKSAEFSQQSVGTSGGAGSGFATHEADFEPTLVINAGDSVALMQAVRDDIASRLAAQGGEIVEESGSPVDGFQIKYAAGKSQGTVAVEPLRGVAATSLPGAGSAPGKVTVNFRIRINETWFEAEGQAASKRTSS